MAIHNNKIWFGTRAHMQWVVAPQINMEAGRRGYAATAGYINGGAFVRRSATAAKGYNLSWTLKKRDEIRAITDYADGVYGPGAIFFLDPFAMDRNVLPQYLAVPALGAIDAPLLIGEYDDDRPTIGATTPNNLGYPVNSAVFNLDANSVANPVWVPCPPGYSLWVGVHGGTTGTAGVRITPTLSSGGTGTVVTPTLLSATNTQRVNTQVNGDNYNGALISLGGVGTLTLHGLIAQVLPNGVTPDTGGFVSGQGHSGCSFVEEPTLTNYSAALDRVGLSVNLVETEGWV